MSPPEPVEVTVARTEQRVIALERDVRDIKATLGAQQQARPSWPQILSAVVATAALIITLITIL